MKSSQVNTLLEAFKRGEHLSAAEAAFKYQIMTFSQRISDIEKRGYFVSRYWQETPKGKKYMVYFMTQEQFRKAA